MKASARIKEKRVGRHGNQFLPKRPDVEFFEKQIPLQFFDFPFGEAGHLRNKIKFAMCLLHQLCRFKLR